MAMVLACLMLNGCATQAALAGFQLIQSAAVNAYVDRETKAQSSLQYGTKIEPATVAQLKKGVTTRTQVEALFGPPQQVVMMGDGKRMMLYGHYTAGERRSLQIILDSANVVQDYEFNVNKGGSGGRSMLGNVDTPTAYPDEKK